VQLIKDSHLIEHIVESTKQNESEVVGERGTHRGYMGHLTLIAQELVKFSETPDLDKDLLGKGEAFIILFSNHFIFIFSTLPNTRVGRVHPRARGYQGA